MMCLGVCFLGSNFFESLWASWKSVSFSRLGKFSFIIFSNKFSISCCSSSPSDTSMIRMLAHLEMSHRFLILSLFFLGGWFFFFVVLIGCFLLHYVQIIDLILGFIYFLLFSCNLLFISIRICFISHCIFFMCQGLH